MNKSRLMSTLQQWNLEFLTKLFLIAGLSIGLVTSYFAYDRLYMTPERRFWIAIENSMTTNSVVRTLAQGASGNQVTQDYRFHYSPQRVIENRVELSERSATVDTQIVTEGIIFPDRQYLRYTSFDSQANGQEANIDSLLGTWASEPAENEEEAKLTYLSEQVTLVVFGNYGTSLRTSYLNDLRDAYRVDFNTATELTNDDGDAVIIYPLRVGLPEYTAILQRSFVDAGYGEFPPLNPENYREGSDIAAAITVRKKDNAVVGIAFGDREESYGNYGLVKQIDAPDAELSIDQLQDQVQAQLQ